MIPTRTFLIAASLALGTSVAVLSTSSGTLAAAETSGTMAPEVAEQGYFAGEGYEVTVSDVTGPVGEQREVEVRVTARSGYTINPEFPSKLLVTAADGIAVQKDKLGRADGAFDGDSFVFTLKASPQHRGAHELRATLRFGVCNDASCLVHRKELVATVTGE